MAVVSMNRQQNKETWHHNAREGPELWVPVDIRDGGASGLLRDIRFVDGCGRWGGETVDVWCMFEGRRWTGPQERHEAAARGFARRVLDLTLP